MNPLSRRKVLSSLGASVALPWLETPSLFAAEPEVPAAGPPRRFACLFVGDGISAPEWTFSGDGLEMKLGRAFASLEDHKEKCVFIDGLHCAHSGGHSRGAAAMLSGVGPLRGREIRAGISLDQKLAKHLGDHTMIPSMVLACERPVSGFHESQNSMVYASHLSWSSPTSPVPAELYPSLAFDSLFGSKGNKTQLSVLDHVLDQLKHVEGQVSRSDKAKIGEYTNSVREVEKRLQKLSAEGGGQNAAASATMERPADTLPTRLDEHSRLMCDIIALAFQTDRTRIATLLCANDLSGQIYPFLGLKDDHHSYSHNNGGEQFRKISRFWVEQFAYLLAKLDGMQEGNGTVLDNSCIMLCNEHWTAHSNKKVPLVLGGGLGGHYKTGRCLSYEKDKNKNMSNLLLHVSHGMGVPLKKFGGSSTPISRL